MAAAAHGKDAQFALSAFPMYALPLARCIESSRILRILGDRGSCKIDYSLTMLWIKRTKYTLYMKREDGNYDSFNSISASRGYGDRH